jgi:hypothetical protein
LRIYGYIITNLLFAICGLAYLRNLRICDCGMSPRVCGFRYDLRTNKIKLRAHLCVSYLSFILQKPVSPAHVTGSLFTSHRNLRKSKDGKLRYIEMIKLSNAYRFLLPKQRILRQRKPKISFMFMNNMMISFSKNWSHKESQSRYGGTVDGTE